MRHAGRVPALSTHPVDVGERSEAVILAAFVERGFLVLLPWGNNQRYDMVLDLGDHVLRVQCKTGRLKNGAIGFSARSVRCNTKQILTRSYHGEIDYFAVYCPETRGIYLVACDDETPQHFSLRVSPPTNGQHKHVRWAAEHELSRWRP
jgi:hypothetical protein